MEKVTITEEGRSGSVFYESEGRRISGWWEFAGGDAVAIVYIGNASEWRHGHPWAVGQRAGIMRFIADEVIRQKASSCKAEIDEEGGWITLKR
ncbi:MAG: hypothetical protein IPK70_11630 [Flavobacteriales bacterium]|jgi:uracil-DNA glycosylase|nr:hypothetical protein [Flavobacteriales bacterium]